MACENSHNIKWNMQKAKLNTQHELCFKNKNPHCVPASVYVYVCSMYPHYSSTRVGTLYSCCSLRTVHSIVAGVEAKDSKL